jgi:undecaprenyl-diphosphatase
MRLSDLDRALLRFARTAGHTPEREKGVARFSRLGEHGALWLAIGAAGRTLAPADRGRWDRALGVVVGTYVLNTGVKLIVRRRRPELEGLTPLTGTPTRLSFPSAHSSTGFAAALLYGRLGVPGGPLLALATTLSLSRLYLGVHYPSDVLAGAALGTAVGLALRGPAQSDGADEDPHETTWAAAEVNGVVA